MKNIFITVAIFTLLVLGFASKALSYAECYSYGCQGGQCQTYITAHPSATHCEADGGPVECVPDQLSESVLCGVNESPRFPYSYPYPVEYGYQYPVEYGYQYPTPCGGQGQACCESQPYCTTAGTVCCRPGSNVCEFVCSGGYSSEYGSPYGAEYSTPAYGTPAYGYQTEYPTPAYGTPSAAFNYSLSNSGNVNVTKSGSNVFANKDITKTLIDGTTESVTLSLSGVPSGVSYSLANGPCSPTCTTTINFTVTPSAQVGTHQITVTGSPLSKTTQFNLIISAAPASSIEVICTPSDEEIVLGETITWTGEVNGGTPPYTYSWNGPGIPTNPAPSTNPITIRYSTVGIKTATLTVTDSEDEQGFCVFDGEGSSQSLELRVNFNPAFEEF